ncbi:MAG: Asp-tRNA(Asn)/Glu-tRNA(Gln) amidotransferase subunit GatA [Patescibacteria group bacterium]|nr:Asp-tRNA(Asn)/Glu-tRNA(Gln) amidotransferase subunit GatA [Patescibacteria group bacterium]MCL5224160.1 Asp-tRNA(Asn)/Glu-tRNA(Gln) amidotransferase subunit GatA [Patescibacteria group bacterium]
MKLEELTIKKFREGLAKKEFSASEVARLFFDYIEVKDKEIEAYLSLNRDGALERARQIDAAVASGKEIPSLAGVPMAIKDVILIEGLPATAASKILEKYVAAYDAGVIKKLKAAGALFLGKTNLDEFAMGSSTEQSAFKVTRNPRDTSLVPGGSSGGSAAAVAADMAVAALGTDTGGSVRQPAAFCGVVGMKPTYGAISRYGVIAMASSLDQVGTFSKTVEDAAILFKEIAGHDPKDATSATVTYGDELVNPDFHKIRELTVGVPEEYFIEGTDAEIISAVQGVMKEFETLKIKVKKIHLPHTKYALSVYYIVMPAEVSTNLARYDGIRYGERAKSENLLDLYYQDRGNGLGLEPKRRSILGTFVLSAGYYDAYYAKAQRVRALIKQDFDEAFLDVDVILTPVTPTLPFKLGEKASDPMQMYLSDIFTITLNLAGLPGISIPVKGRGDKLPIGFQLIGRPWHEADILGLGRYYEQS